MFGWRFCCGGVPGVASESVPCRWCLFEDGVAVDLQPPEVVVAPDDQFMGFQDEAQRP
jgi:hypothetical protein